jgi:chromosome segregation ATPase
MTSTEVLKRNEKNLLAKIQSQDTKRRKIETQCISLNKENETLIQEKEQLMARLCSVKHDAKEQEQELLQCQMQQETIRLEALEAFNNGVQHAAKEQHQTILLPKKLMPNH